MAWIVPHPDRPRRRNPYFWRHKSRYGDCERRERLYASVDGRCHGRERMMIDGVIAEEIDNYEHTVTMRPETKQLLPRPWLQSNGKHNGNDVGQVEFYHPAPYPVCPHRFSSPRRPRLLHVYRGRLNIVDAMIELSGRSY